MHLFAGSGGGIMADLLLGHRPICAVEKDPHCQQVLQARQRDGCLPRFPIFGDVLDFDGNPWHGLVDILCAGIPCQKVSAAGDGEGFLFTDYYAAFKRIVCEVRPAQVFLENSPLLVSRGLGGLLGFLAQIGYDGRWGVLSAGALGAPHDRARIWILASDTMRQRGARQEPGISFSEAGPWGACRPKDLLSILERPIERPDCLPQPLLCRMDDGLANSLDRLKAVGNGQVPIVAATAFRRLCDHENART